MDRRRCALLALTVVAVPATARGGGLALDLISPRGVGRAGATMVSDDGAAAVVLNPAALARRDSWRFQLGYVVLDDAAWYDAEGAGPVVSERGPTTSHPVLGVQGRLGPLVIGAAFLDEANASRRFAAPSPGQPVDDVEALHPHRYAGLTAEHRRRTVGIAASWRANDWLAIGASMTLSRVSLSESRRVWAGFAGRDALGGAGRDVTVQLDGADAVVPGGAVGVLIAPIDVPVELAIAATWADDAHLGGDARATAGRPGEAPSVEASSPTASATLSTPLVLRTGVRWLGERWIAELGGELWTYPGADDPRWTVTGIRIVDETGSNAPLASLRSQLSRRNHGAIRAAVDVEVVSGFLWLTAGYAYATASTSPMRLSPAAGDLGGHTGALGVEVLADGFTVTLGLARTFARATEVPVTSLTLDNPFDAGTAPTGLGRHDHSRDVVALSVELDLP